MALVLLSVQGGGYPLLRQDCCQSNDRSECQERALVADYLVHDSAESGTSYLSDSDSHFDVSNVDLLEVSHLGRGEGVCDHLYHCTGETLDNSKKDTHRDELSLGRSWEKGE